MSMQEQDTQLSLEESFYKEFGEYPYRRGGVVKREYVQWLEGKVKSQDPYFEIACWLLVFTWGGIIIWWLV